MDSKLNETVVFSDTALTYTKWELESPSNFSLKCICFSPQVFPWFWSDCTCDSSLNRQFICFTGENRLTLIRPIIMKTCYAYSHTELIRMLDAVRHSPVEKRLDI